MRNKVLRLHLCKNENHEMKVNNSFIVWRPMSLLEDRIRETGKRQVANVCVMNGAKGAELIIFWRVSDLYCHGNLMR